VGGPIEAVGAVLAEAVASVGGVGGILPVAPAQDGQGCEDDQKDASEGLGRHVAIDSIEEGAGSDAKHSSSGNRLGRGASSERETSTNSHHGVAKPCHVAATSGSVVDTTAPVEHELSEEEADVFEEAEECSDVDMDTNRAVPSRQHRAEDPPAGSGEEDGEEDGWDEEYVSDSEWQQMEAAAAAAARDFAEGSSSTAASRDWLPLHRAAENLRLRLQRVRVIVEQGSQKESSEEGSGSVLELRLAELHLTTTDAQWREEDAPMAQVRDGAELHKRIRLHGLEVAVLDRAYELDGEEPKPIPQLILSAPEPPLNTKAPLAQSSQPSSNSSCTLKDSLVNDDAAQGTHRDADAHGVGQQSDFAQPGEVHVGDPAQSRDLNDDGGPPGSVEIIDTSRLSAACGAARARAHDDAACATDRTGCANNNAPADEDFARRINLLLGICGELRLTKHLKQELFGSVVRDFAGGSYDVSLALSSAQTPRFEVPEMRVRLKWQAERKAYSLSFLSGAQVSLTHGVDSVALSAAAGWYARLRRAQAAVAPPAEELLRAAQEEIARLRKTLARSEEAQRQARLSCLAAELLSSVLPSTCKNTTETEENKAASPVRECSMGPAREKARGAFPAGTALDPPGVPNAMARRKIPSIDSSDTSASHSTLSDSQPLSTPVTSLGEVAGAQRLAYESTCAYLASAAMEAQQRTLSLHTMLIGLLAEDDRLEAIQALEACQALCTHTTTSAAEGAVGMQAIMALANDSASQEAPRTDNQSHPVSANSWRTLSGRMNGPEGYRLGDGARTALRWIGSRHP